MKIQRYLGSGAEVAAAQSTLQSHIGAREAAAHEMALSGAVTRSLESAQYAVGRYSSEQERKQREEAQLTLMEAVSELNIAEDSVLKDPQLKSKYSQDPRHLDLQYEEAAFQAQTRVDEIKDPAIRKEAQRRLQLKLTETKNRFAMTLGNLGVQMRVDRSTEMFAEAERAGNADEMALAAKVMQPYIGEAKYQSLITRAETTRKNQESLDLAKPALDAFKRGDIKAGLAEYEKLQSRDDLPHDVHTQAKNYMEAGWRDAKLAATQAEAEAGVGFFERSVADKLLVVRGSLGVDEVKDNFKAGVYGPPTSSFAQSTFKELTFAAVSAQAQEASKLDVSARLDSGVPLGAYSKDKAEALQSYISDAIPENTAPEMADAMETRIIQDAGIYSANMVEMMNIAGASYGHFSAAAIQKFLDVNSNPSRRVSEKGPTSDALELFEGAEVLVRDLQYPIEVAREMAWQAYYPADKREREIRAESLKTPAMEEVKTEKFETWVEDALDGYGLEWGDLDGHEQAVISAQWGARWDENYKTWGRPDVVDRLTGRQSLENLPISNAGSRDADKYYVEPTRTPLSGDVREFNEAAFNVLTQDVEQGKALVWSGEAYTSDTEALSDLSLRFRPVNADRSGKIVGDVAKFQVFDASGRPLIVDTTTFDGDKEVATVEIYTIEVDREKLEVPIQERQAVRELSKQRQEAEKNVRSLKARKERIESKIKNAKTTWIYDSPEKLEKRVSQFESDLWDVDRKLTDAQAIQQDLTAQERERRVKF